MHNYERVKVLKKCICNDKIIPSMPIVVDSRKNKDNDSVRRRRECTKCGQRFTTYEVLGHTLFNERVNETKKKLKQENFIKNVKRDALSKLSMLEKSVLGLLESTPRKEGTKIF